MAASLPPTVGSMGTLPALSDQYWEPGSGFSFECSGVLLHLAAGKQVAGEFVPGDGLSLMHLVIYGWNLGLDHSGDGAFLGIEHG